ncbi:MAG: carboxypeptidase regulatory-like domain-containing protein [bacterium]
MKNGKLLLTLFVSAAMFIFISSCRETPANPDGFINISGTVVNVDGTVITAAKVDAVDATNKIIATDLTNENSVFSLSNIPANIDNVFLVVTKAGYKTLKVSLKSLLENVLDNKIILVLEKEGQNQDCCGNIHFTITDEASRKPINDVEVRLNQEGNVIAKYMTGQDGKVNFEKLCPGNYWVRVYREGYAVIEKQIVVANCDPININLLLVKSTEDPCCGVVNMMIFDKDSKAGIAEVTVILHYGDKIIEKKYTDARGVVGFTGLCMGKYWVSIERTGYKTIIQDFNIINCDPLNITFAMEKAGNTDCCGKIYVKVYDKTNEKRLGGREVTLYSGNVVVAKQVTNENGEAGFTELCMGNYLIKVAAEGYKGLVYEVRVMNCEPITLSLALEPITNQDCCGKIIVTAYDKTSQKLLAGAEVRLTANGQVITKKTNDYGVAIFEGLCPGKYGLRIALEGYKVIEQSVGVINCDPINITALMEKISNNDCCGKIYLSLFDKTTNKPIAGAEVKLTSSDGKIVTVKTNDNGVASFSELCMGKYYIHVVREGYKVLEVVVLVENCEPVQVSYGMELIANDCCGKIHFTITDKATGKPLVGTEVKLTSADGKVVLTQKTNETGLAGFADLCMGKYYIRIAREGYKVIEQYVVIENCDLIQKAITLESASDNDCCKGILAVIVTDQSTQKPIIGAIVKLWLNGKEVRSVKTNEQGYALMDGLCNVEYGVSIHAEGYKGIEYKYTHPCNEKVYQNKTLAKADDCCKGILYITVIDQATKKAIPGAYVKLWQNGKIIKSAQAGDYGVAVIDGICEGEYAVGITVDGYKEIEYKYTHTCNATVKETKYVVKKEVPCTGKLKLQYVDPTKDTYYVSNAEVKLMLNGKQIAATTTNSEGWAVFEGLCTGKYIVNASHEGYAIKEADYAVTTGQTTTDKLEMIPVK